MIWVPAFACAALTAALVVAEYVHHQPAKIVTKTGAAWAFLVHALTLGAWEHGAAGRWVLLGLALSMVGDLCLLSREKRWFLGGLGAFLLAHVAYVAAFLTLGVAWLAAAFAALAVAGASWRVWVWLRDHVGELGGPVIAYVAVIGAMVSCAAGSAAFGGVGRWGLFLAAIVFFLSDLCVARDRFVAPGWENRLVGLPLYFGAQLLFGWFVVLA